MIIFLNTRLAACCDLCCDVINPDHELAAAICALHATSGSQSEIVQSSHSRLFFPAESREVSSDHDQEITWAVNLQDGDENQNPDYKD